MDQKGINWNAKQCVMNAKHDMGCGWGHISADLQWGLIAAHILFLRLNVSGITLEDIGAITVQAGKLHDLDSGESRKSPEPRPLEPRFPFSRD